MSEYKSDKSFKELRDMKRNEKWYKKIFNKLPDILKKNIKGVISAGVIVTGMVSGLGYSYLSDTVTQKDVVKNTSVETQLPKTSAVNEPAFSKFLENNMETFKNIRKDLLRYKELHNMHSLSDEKKIELNKLIEKINSNSNTIEKLALNTVKSKLADAYGLSSYDDIIINVDMESHSFVAKEKATDKALFHSINNDRTNLSDTVIKLMDLQNMKADSSIKAIRLYGLYNNTAKVANETYIAKDGKIMQVDNIDLDKGLDEER